LNGNFQAGGGLKFSDPDIVGGRTESSDCNQYGNLHIMDISGAKKKRNRKPKSKRNAEVQKTQNSTPVPGIVHW
jgi:hypothetical protein